MTDLDAYPDHVTETYQLIKRNGPIKSEDLQDASDYAGETVSKAISELTELDAVRSIPLGTDQRQRIYFVV